MSPDFDKCLEQIEKLQAERERESDVPQEIRDRIDALEAARQWLEIGRKDAQLDRII